jgi:hypothetical protein
MLAGLFQDKDWMVAHIEDRLESYRRQARRGTPTASISERLDKLDGMRRGFQVQQAAGLMTLDELRQRLAEQDDERRTLQGQLAAANRTAADLAELEREAAIIISLYAGRLANFQDRPPEERRDVYRRLGIQASISKGGLVNIEGDLAANPLPYQLGKTHVRAHPAPG